MAEKEEIKCMAEINRNISPESVEIMCICPEWLEVKSIWSDIRRIEMEVKEHNTHEIPSYIGQFNNGIYVIYEDFVVADFDKAKEFIKKLEESGLAIYQIDHKYDTETYPEDVSSDLPEIIVEHYRRGSANRNYKEYKSRFR